MMELVFIEQCITGVSITQAGAMRYTLAMKR